MTAVKRGTVDALQRIGVPRVEATLVVFMVQRGSADTKDIVARTGLRQPEVSVGMRTLRERGWVDAEPVPRSKKGRPMNRYHLTVAPGALADHFLHLADEAVSSLEEARAHVLEALRAPGLQHAHAARPGQVHSVA